ncbi:MarR family transcriptional regulator [Methylobacterium sp. Leaf361]|uniref:MarR family winged helix-turn-helix transcriptional regulator n=1 Tax=Methylobacterium sp. Leaf361 TaxID=1736352 RepID=UPI0006F2F48C|nr:MarR family winged helix-turn-helix transcriptional regulator [Methylobacterium sp. Leaf361]KQS74280.1 MarR family transcriptional regulator [Methylobacterium sp. Leaf361]
MDDLPPEACSCSAVRQAARHLTRLYDGVLAPIGLGLNQYSILAKVDRHGEPSVQQLAALLVMDRSTLGHLLRPLDRRGLLTVRQSASDGRRRVVALTPEGSALLALAKPLWKSAEEGFQASFGQDEAAGLKNLMRQVTTTDLPGTAR